MRKFLLALVLLALGFALGQVVPGVGPGDLSPAAAPTPAAVAPEPPIPTGLTDSEQRTIEVFREASRSVVYITSVALRRDFFTLDVMQIPQGAGSGFVWDRDGHVVTNYHVIQNGSRFTVTLADHSEWEAEVVGSAPDKDLAVLKITAPADRLVPLGTGHSRDLVVGQQVLAIGNPFGLDQTLTTGIVSAIGRELQSPSGRMIRDVVQTDAAINPGNSGGPLLDSAGRLIGVNTAIYSPTGTSAGIGFAVPVDTVARLVPQLIEHGAVIQPGIGFVPLAERWAQRLGVTGIVVQEVQPGGPAARAGLQGLTVDRRRRITLGDRIVAVDGEEIERLDDLLYAFERAGVGARVTLTVENGTGRRDLELVLVAVAGER